MNAVLWTEVGPRDGLQNLSQVLPTNVKVNLIKDLLAAGAPRVEATSFVSPQRVPQLADAADVLTALPRDVFSKLRVLVPNLQGLQAALRHGVRNVVVTIAVTDTFNQRNINRTVEQSLAELPDIVAAAGAAGCTVDVALSVCFGCPFEGVVSMERVLALVESVWACGLGEVALADTIGVAGPADVRALCAHARDVVGADGLALHVHDTRGMGVANVLAAYDVGVRRFEGSVGGLGGCPFAPNSTGNVCSEDALLALENVGTSTGCDVEKYCDVARTLSSTLHVEFPGKLHRAGVWSRQRIAGENVATRR